MFVSVDLFAFTFNNEDNPTGIGLDTPINELNGYTLREVFEDFNLDNINNFSWLGTGRVSINLEQYNYIDFTITQDISATLAGQTHEMLNSSHLYYLRYTDYLLSGSMSYSSIRLDNSTTSRVVGNPVINQWNSYSVIVNGIDNIDYSYIRIDPVIGSRLIIKDYIRINLSIHGLNLLTTDELDYYHTIYKLLSNGIDPTTLYADYYNEGYNDGYDDGETYGYTDGYNDGLVEGYFDGNAAYHQGIYEYDYLTGVPYLEGLETGYNNGVDYAVQENISILSIFELIFGVALNMLTFIITIDIFGISILSLISVLSLFVGVVWILKMIRG